ncbi:MAG: hypothetical protein AAGA96_12740 [Verrucomicrobiota bacterium]
MSHRLILNFLAALVISASLTGCGGNWLEGKWVFDQEQTLQSMTPPNEPSAAGDEGLLKGMISGLQKGISQMMMNQLKGVEVEFTGDEMRRTQYGSGEAISYEIIEKPDAETVVIKFADGEINTVKRSETGIRMLMPGDGSFWIHFKPVAN